MAEETVEQKPSLITDMNIRNLMSVMIVGLIAGAIAGGVTLLLSMYVFKVTPCYGETCGSGGQYAAVLAGIVSAIVALLWLIRLQIFRPLLVVIAVTIALWGIGLHLLNLQWYYFVLISAGLHAIAYGFFAWVSRIRLFWLVVILLLASVVGLRLILLNS